MQVHFYVLEVTNGQKSLYFACHLLEKLYLEQKKIYVHLPTEEEAKRFDALLWTYRDDSFVPHQLSNATEMNPAPIEIGYGIDYGQAPIHQHDVLINLTNEILPFSWEFNTIIEIVFAEPLMQQLARERYRQYRDKGCEIETHKIKANEVA